MKKANFLNTKVIDNEKTKLKVMGNEKKGGVKVVSIDISCFSEFLLLNLFHLKGPWLFDHHKTD